MRKSALKGVTVPEKDDSTGEVAPETISFGY